MSEDKEKELLLQEVQKLCNNRQTLPVGSKQFLDALALVLNTTPEFLLNNYHYYSKEAISKAVSLIEEACSKINVTIV